MSIDSTQNFWHITAAENDSTEIWIHWYIGESFYAERISDNKFIEQISAIK